MTGNEIVFWLIILMLLLVGWFDGDQEHRHKNRYRKRHEGDDFYRSPEWKVVRTIPISEAGPRPRCNYCGVYVYGPNLHVDHILPRSKYPELAFTPSNLQILCKDCNMRKGNH